MRKIRATHRSMVIALLRDRLDFERAVGALYSTVLQRLDPRGGPFDSVRAHLRRIREEEKSHEEWLEEQLRAIGGGRGEEEPPLTVRSELRRIGEQIDGTADPARLFAALRDAELADGAGWELLRELADRAQDGEARDAFDQRLSEEHQHMIFVNRMAAVFANSELLDKTLTTMDEPAIGAHT